MVFNSPLIKGQLIKRYKRFLADVELDNGETVTAHCPNTGAMTGCAEPGFTVWLSPSDNPKRKLKYTWELTETFDKHRICVNTQRANALLEEALNDGVITPLSGFSDLRREVKYGSQNSRIDALLRYPNAADTYVEAKSVTLLESEQGYFPDAVSVRGQKHLLELSEMAAAGHRAVLFFAVLHTGINTVSPAAHIDPKYAELLHQAVAQGVEVMAYKATLDAHQMKLTQRVDVVL